VTLTSEDIEREYKAKRFKFSVHTIRKQFAGNLTDALEAAGIKKTKVPEINSEKIFSIRDIELWVHDYISENRWKPKLQDMEVARQKGELPDQKTIDKLLRPKRDSMHALITRQFAQWDTNQQNLN